MVAIAGSIGIIGIALILGLSNGVNQFIKDTEEETDLHHWINLKLKLFQLFRLNLQLQP